MSGVRFGKDCRSPSEAVLKSTSLPACACAGALATATSANVPTRAESIATIILLKVISCTPSVADVGERIGEAQEAHLYHHAGGEQGRGFGAHDLVHQLPRVQIRIELELVLERAVEVRRHTGKARQD